MSTVMPNYSFSEFKNFMNEKTEIMNKINYVIAESHVKYGSSIVVVSVANIRSGVIDSADHHIFKDMIEANNFINRYMYEKVAIQINYYNIESDTYVSVMSKNYDSCDYYRCAGCGLHQVFGDDGQLLYIARELFNTNAKVWLH